MGYQPNLPLPTVLPAITANGVGLKITQVGALAFQLAGTPFTSLSDIQTKTVWDALIGATDNTKIVMSPIMSNTKIMEGKVLETGIDSNATFQGIPEYFGTGIAKIQGEFHGLDAATIESLRAYTSLSQLNNPGQANLCAYLINEFGQIICDTDGSTYWAPIVLRSFGLENRGTEGHAANDIVKWQAYLDPSWDSNVIAVIPTFNPLGYVIQL